MLMPQVQFYDGKILFKNSGAIAMDADCCCCYDEICGGGIPVLVYGIRGVISGVPTYSGSAIADGVACGQLNQLSQCVSPCTYYEEYLHTWSPATDTVNGTYDGLLYPSELSSTPFTEEETAAILAGLDDFNAEDFCKNYRASLSYVWKFPTVSLTYNNTWSLNATYSSCSDSSDNRSTSIGGSESSQTWAASPDAWTVPWGVLAEINRYCGGTDFTRGTTSLIYSRNPRTAVPLFVCDPSAYESTTDHSGLTVPDSLSENYSSGTSPCEGVFSVDIDNGTAGGQTVITLITTP